MRKLKSTQASIVRLIANKAAGMQRLARQATSCESRRFYQGAVLAYRLNAQFVAKCFRDRIIK